MAAISSLLRDGAARLTERAGNRISLFARRNHDRMALWLPVLFGTGIGVYFALPSEPPPWIAIAAVGGALPAALLFGRRRGAVFFAALMWLAIAGGFAAAQWRSGTVAAPVVERRIGPVEVVGRVVHAEPGEMGARLLLDRLRIGRLAQDALPERVRLSVRSTPEIPLAGATVRALAVLQPPPEPSLPGGFDFARKAWFERIGGVGYVLGRVTIDPAPPDAGWAVGLANLRQAVTARIHAAAGASVGPVAAALMTGERRAIPEDVLAAMRDSGLAHLLAISGLHIGLVAGLLFFGVRLLLAAVEPVALRYPIKKIAALAALAGAFAYLLISGATIPTQRAFLMTGIVLFAVLIDRTAISMRLVAIAAAIVLLIAPESLLGPSFQMSFAAVVALVAVYETAAPRLSAWRRNAIIPGGRIGAFVAATLLTSLVAGLATAPFAAYHFNRLALFGLAANMIAVPVMAMWIMPWAIVAFLLMPLGLESVGLVPMGWGIEAVLAVASGVAALPGAAALVPPLPTAGLILIAIGGLWLCLWRGWGRALGLCPIAVGIATALFVTPPDILIGRDGDLVAVSVGDGTVAMSPGRGNRFERQMWMRHFAAGDAATWPSSGIGLGGRMGCDDTGCVVEIRGRTVSLIRNAEAAVDDCGRSDYFVVLDRLSGRLCPGAPVVVNSFLLWRDGTHAVRFTESGAMIESSREMRGDRPWSALSDIRRQYLRTSPTSLP
ncbi:MAG: ComEC/Rec2 family competence protein [Rhodospirillaceae bacterium]